VANFAFLKMKCLGAVHNHPGDLCMGDQALLLLISARGRLDPSKGISLVSNDSGRDRIGSAAVWVVLEERATARILIW
jgi:hypothetical protein